MSSTRTLLSGLLAPAAVVVGCEASKSAAPNDATKIPAAPVASQLNTFGEFSLAAPITHPGDSQSDFRQHTFADHGRVVDLAIDPATSSIVFSAMRDSNHSDLYLQRPGSNAAIRLTRDADRNCDAAFPAFSRDGTQIAFASTRGGTWDIYVMRSDGENVRRITADASHEVHPSFSPDGELLVYSAAQNTRDSDWKLWTLNLKTGVKQTIGRGLFPSFNPSRGRREIAFQKCRAQGSRWFSLCTMELSQTGEPIRENEIAVSDNSAVVSPGWNADGSRLTFATIVEPGQSQPDGPPRGQQDVWTINPDGSDRRRITDGAGINCNPVWSRDGRIFFISDRAAGIASIWSTSVDQVAMRARAQARVTDKRDMGS